MSILKTAPRIEIRAPWVVTGQPFAVDVLLHCSDSVPVDRVNVRVVGEARYEAPYREGIRSPTNPVPTPDRTRVILYASRVSPVEQRVELPAGCHSYRTTFQIPPHIPGSYRGGRLAIHWRVKVDVDIPWWPDAHAACLLHVTHDPAAHRSYSLAAPAPPCFVATNPNGPYGRSAYAELSLATTVIRAGDVLRGYVSLANKAYNRYLGIRISLCHTIAIGAFRTIRYTESVRTMQLAPFAPDNHPVPFGLQIPENALLGFDVPGLRLTWSIRCTIHTEYLGPLALTLPVEITPTSAPLLDRGRTPSLAAIGSERLHRVWAQAAIDTGFSLESGVLVRRQDSYTLIISLESNPIRGNQLVAYARIEPVDIGLHLDDGQLRCRAPEHSESIAEATDEFTDRYALSTADDAHLRFEVSDGGTRRKAVVGLARWADTLVNALLAARAQLTVPAALAHLQSAFERAAAMLQARFVPVAMNIWGRRDDVPFSLETRWNGSNDRWFTTLTVHTLVPIPGRHRGQFEPEAWPDTPPRGLTELLEGAVMLNIGEYGIELYLPPLLASDSVDAEIESAVGRLEGLIAVGRRLSMRDGIYR